jgi:hypothetical protein
VYGCGLQGKTRTVFAVACTSGSSAIVGFFSTALAAEEKGTSRIRSEKKTTEVGKRKSRELTGSTSRHFRFNLRQPPKMAT